ncbi:FEKKY domain-containing protein [Niabella ginsengisoli]|uniref:VCBS repeat-containing protein n=1 Tax=Niabella ginsengisoli TaxID=522298 RepID=A0ABS9SGK9_9BACT|nr:hypothetical protein [Niabella ginsengisoli]MCH5597485.1 hypothetical protein [Niabella ginsengisoli]
MSKIEDYEKILLSLLLFQIVVSCGQKQSKPAMDAAASPPTDTTSLWVDYRIGELPPEGYYDAFDSIIRKWNIRYQRTEGGCEATPSEKQQHEAGNEKYFRQLEAKFGKDWRQQFDAEVKKLDSLLVVQKQLRAIGEEIQGDFDGDGKLEFAKAVKVKEGQGNPVEDGTPDEYEIQFSNHKLKPIKAGCCDIRLVNEGDLNNDGSNEFSIFQAPMNGCTYTMTTYSYSNKSWKQIVKPFLCQPLAMI